MKSVHGFERLAGSRWRASGLNKYTPVGVSFLNWDAEIPSRKQTAGAMPPTGQSLEGLTGTSRKLHLIQGMSRVLLNF